MDSPRDLLREVLELCKLGDVDESTDALGWGDLVKRVKVVLSTEPPSESVRVAALRAALEPFAEDPSRLDNYICHHGICSKERCGRCSRAIAAWNAYHME